MMEKITRDHLSRPYAQLPDGLESMLHAEKRGGRFYFIFEKHVLGVDSLLFKQAKTGK